MIYIFIIILILFIIYAYFQNNFLKVSYYEIENKKINKDFKNFKIAHISDYHNFSSNKLNKDLVSNLITIKPDIIVISGDFIDSRNTKINVSLELIKKINSIAPIYYVPGNHESRLDEYNDFKKKLKELNVHVLENKKEAIIRGNSKLNVLGIIDPRFSNKSKEFDSDVIKDYIDKLKHDNKEYNILLSHRPEFFLAYVEKSIDLVFSGHAHGGQIRFPFTDGLFAPGQGIFPKLTSGVRKSGNTTLVISRGIGKSVFPFRINNRPELVIATLKSK